MTHALAIAATGAVTATGVGVDAASAALRATVGGFVRTAEWRSAVTGEPLRAGVVEMLDPEMPWIERVCWLASHAADDAFSQLGDAARRGSWHALLSLPPRRPGHDEGIGAAGQQAILRELPCRAHLVECGAVTTAHDAAITCLDAACELLNAAAGKPTAVLILGADSWLDRSALAWLESHQRIHTTEASFGFVPAEAAAAIVFANDAWFDANGCVPIGGAGQVSCGYEQDPWFMGRPSRHGGLTTALQGVFGERASDARAVRTWCDLNGEAWRAAEWMSAYLRSAPYHSEPLDLVHPADTFGDVGAATGALLMALALDDLARSRTTAPCIVWAASDISPARAAVALYGPVSGVAA